MVQRFSSVLPTQHVMARLYAEGWVDCPELGIVALSQVPSQDLRQFVLNQLQQAEGSMWQQDLELATLIFSIPDHEFQIHPQLQLTLKQLEAEGMIQIHSAGASMAKFGHIALVSLTTTVAT